MEDRIATAAKIVAEFNGTIESAEMVLGKIDELRNEISRQIVTLTKEINAIEGFIEYILEKRNELAHDKKGYVPGKLVMESKRERVDAVLRAALDVVQNGIPIFGISDITRQLKRSGIELGVSYPPAVIATILTADKRFKRNDKGLYEYIGGKRRRK